MPPRVSMIVLGVADLAVAVPFYRDGLGWTPHEKSAPRVALFRLEGGALLALCPWRDLGVEVGLREMAAFPPSVLACNVETEDAVGVALARAVAAGGRLVRPAQAAPWGGWHGWFADPDGHFWEVVWNPRWPLDAAGRLT